MKQYTFIPGRGAAARRIELSRADGEKVLVSAGGPAVFLTDSEVGVVRHRGLIAREVPAPAPPVVDVAETAPEPEPAVEAVPDVSPPRRRRSRSSGTSDEE